MFTGAGILDRNAQFHLKISLKGKHFNVSGQNKKQRQCFEGHPSLEILQPSKCSNEKQTRGWDRISTLSRVSVRRLPRSRKKAIPSVFLLLEVEGRHGGCRWATPAVYTFPPLTVAVRVQNLWVAERTQAAGLASGKVEKNRKSVFSLTPHPPSSLQARPAAAPSSRSSPLLRPSQASPATRAGWLTPRSPLTSAGAFSARLRTNWAMILGRRARHPDWPAECHPPGRTCLRTPVRFQGQASPFRAGTRYLGVPLSFRHPVGQFFFFSHRGESGYEKMRSEST